MPRPAIPPAAAAAPAAQLSEALLTSAYVPTPTAAPLIHPMARAASVPPDSGSTSPKNCVRTRNRYVASCGLLTSSQPWAEAASRSSLVKSRLASEMFWNET